MSGRPGHGRAPASRIGIDVGGTHTDAVLVEGGRVRAAVKRPTTADVTAGVLDALRALLAAAAEGGADPAAANAVMVGTTHFTNAVVQRHGLEPVAAIRACLPSGRSLPPFVDWPPDLARLVRGEVCLVDGGHEVDGRPLVALDEEAVRRAALRIRENGITTVAVSAVFSPLRTECEDRMADILRAELPEIAITKSHELGRIGLLGRENAALLNAALIPLARSTVRALEQAVRASGIHAPLFLTQNDGTVTAASLAVRQPIHCFSSGPTNSMRGAAYLTGERDAMVVDVGGTTTDVGHLRGGYPREANRAVHIGGVRTLFRMPDLLSLGLGGGSLVDVRARTVGPASVGHRLVDEALVFGGDALTATDVAVAAGMTAVGDPAAVAHLPADLLGWCTDLFRTVIEEAVDRMKPDPAPLPLLAVGGGAFLVPDRLPGIAEVVRPPHAEVANAVGAAIAQVSGEVDRVYAGMNRDEALARARDAARRAAVEAGADPAALEVVECEDLPLAYLPGDALRVRVRVVGDASAQGAARPVPHEP